MGFADLALLFPWVLDTLKGEEFDQAYAGLPAAFKELYDQFWRKQYNEITAAFAIN